MPCRQQASEHFSFECHAVSDDGYDVRAVAGLAPSKSAQQTRRTGAETHFTVSNSVSASIVRLLMEVTVLVKDPATSHKVSARQAFEPA